MTALTHLQKSQESAFTDYFENRFSFDNPTNAQIFEILASASLSDQDYATDKVRDMIERVRDYFEDKEIPTFDLDSRIAEIISDIPRADSDGYDPADMGYWDCGRILNGLVWIGADTTLYESRIKRMKDSNELGRDRFTDPTILYPMSDLAKLWFRK